MCEPLKSGVFSIILYLVNKRILLLRENNKIPIFVTFGSEGKILPGLFREWQIRTLTPQNQAGLTGLHLEKASLKPLSQQIRVTATGCQWRQTWTSSSGRGELTGNGSPSLIDPAGISFRKATRA